MVDFVKTVIAIVTHRNFLVCFTAWSVAQGIKLFWYYRLHRRWNWKLLVGTGGMPSAHMTLVSCFATLVGLKEGWGSPIFQVALVLSLIVMSDAWGLRQAAGRQAVVLNRVVRAVFRKVHVKPKPLKELLGHSPLEVLAGAALGIVFAVIFSA